MSFRRGGIRLRVAGQGRGSGKPDSTLPALIYLGQVAVSPYFWKCTLDTTLSLAYHLIHIRLITSCP